MNKINFSLLITVYKSEKSSILNRSLESCWDAQTLKPNDIVLVKDGKLNFELDAVIDQWKNKLGSQLNVITLEKNVGLGEALSIGILECKHELVARMDTDDISLNNRFKLQINEFYKDPNLDCVGSLIEEFDEDSSKTTGIRFVPESNSEIYSYSKSRNPMNHPSVMYKKNSVLKAGGPKNFTGFDDYYLWVRMMKNNSVFKNIQKPLLKMNAGKKQSKRRGGLSYIYKEASFFYNIFLLGHINFFEMLVNLFFRLPARILPSSIRYYYYKVLRK